MLLPDKVNTGLRRRSIPVPRQWADEIEKAAGKRRMKTAFFMRRGLPATADLIRDGLFPLGQIVTVQEASSFC
jgi:hypothetical protein